MLLKRDNKGVFSINYHLTKRCNMNCMGCFATYKNIDENGDYLTILKSITDYSKDIVKKKINFVGGEPTLIKELPKMVKFMKSKGFTVSIVTNGILITEEYLNRFEILPDWIGVSIDSFDNIINRKIGRYNKNFGVVDYIKISNLIKKYGIKLKINTVVSKFNYNENMEELIKIIAPDRWKVFQFLEIEGENDKNSELFKISKEQFQYFIDNHLDILGVKMVPEDNNSMTESYLMVSPEGTLFDNVGGVLNYSSSLLTTPFEKALNEIKFSYRKFKKRDGDYQWD